MNNVVLIGRLVRDPELRYLPNGGTATANFTLAVDKGLTKDKKQEMEAQNRPTADFIRIVTWGKLAENCSNFLARGRLVGVQGRIQTGSYDDKDGKKVYTTEILARNVEFLEWGDKKEGQAGGVDGFTETDMGDIPF